MYPNEGDVIEGKYRVDRMLGEGGMGAVFAATHLIRKAPVALKFMSPSAAEVPEAVGRFMNEAVAASELSSDHVVKVFDVGRWGEIPYLVMEYLQGHDLAEEIDQCVARGQPMETGRAIHFVLQVLRALQVAHAKGIVHRDLKPANAFLVTHEGEPDFVKLLDFGISKRSQEQGAVSLTRTNVAMGTPLYMAPEQAKSARDADARSDLYSVAAILYELLANRPPLEAETYNMILFKLFQEDPKPIGELRPDLPAGLDEVVHQGLAKEPMSRFQNATSFAEALAPYADERSRVVLSRLLGARGSLVGSAPTGSHAVVSAAPRLPASEAKATAVAARPSLPQSRDLPTMVGPASSAAVGGYAPTPMQATNVQGAAPSLQTTGVAFSPKETDPGAAAASAPAQAPAAKSSKAPMFIAVAALAIGAAGAAVFMTSKKGEPAAAGASSASANGALATAANTAATAPGSATAAPAKSAEPATSAAAAPSVSAPVVAASASAKLDDGSPKKPAGKLVKGAAASTAAVTPSSAPTEKPLPPTPKKKLDWQLGE